MLYFWEQAFHRHYSICPSSQPQKEATARVQTWFDLWGNSDLRERLEPSKGLSTSDKGLVSHRVKNRLVPSYGTLVCWGLGTLSSESRDHGRGWGTFGPLPTLPKYVQRLNQRHSFGTSCLHFRWPECLGKDYIPFTVCILLGTETCPSAFTHTLSGLTHAGPALHVYWAAIPVARNIPLMWNGNMFLGTSLTKIYLQRYIKYESGKPRTVITPHG